MSRITPSPSPGATSSVSTNLSRIAPFVDPSALEGGGKRLSELELENSRLHSKFVIAEREAAQKDQEIRRLVIEHRASKASLEKVIKELVDKQKQMEIEFQRKHRHQEEALHKISSEHLTSAHAVSDVKQTLREWKQLLNDKDREIEQWKSANLELEREEHHLQEQFDALQQHAHQLETDVAHSRRQEEAVQDDLDMAMNKLAKADEHIHKLSAEAEHNAIELVRLKHLCEAAEVDAQVAREEHAEVSERLAHLTRSAAGEMDRLSLECDELLEYMKASTISRNRGSSIASTTFTDVNRVQRLFLLSPEKGTADDARSPSKQKHNTSSSQSQMSVQGTVTLMRRLVEALSLVREDLSVSHRAAVEILRNSKELERKIEILTEALQHERSTAIEAADRADSLEESLKAERDKISTLESSLAQSARWMEEAASLGEESSSRTAKLVREQREMNGQLEQARDEVQRCEQQLRKKDEELRSLHHSSSLLEQQFGECKERLRLAEKRNHLGTRDSDDLLQKLQDKDKQSHQLESVISKLDGEKTFLVRQLADAEERLKTQGKHIDSVEAANSELRSKLFETQKRLDNVLRQVSTTTSTASSSTPLRQRPVTGQSPLAQSQQRRQSPTAPSRQLDDHHDSLRPPMGKPIVGRPQHIFSSAKTQDLDAQDAPRAASIASSPSGPLFNEHVDKVKSWEDRLNSLLNARSRV